MQPIQILMLQKPFGFVTSADMPEIIRFAPIVPLLMRCGRERYLMPACLVSQTIAVIEANGDYLRDVSFPVHILDEARKAQKQDKARVAGLVATVTAVVKATPSEPLTARQQAALNARLLSSFGSMEEEYRGDHGGGL